MDKNYKKALKEISFKMILVMIFTYLACAIYAGSSFSTDWNENARTIFICSVLFSAVVVIPQVLIESEKDENGHWK